MSMGSPLKPWERDAPYFWMTDARAMAQTVTGEAPLLRIA